MTEEIEKFIREHGVTLCPTMPAVQLGESNPGWRRDRELSIGKSGKRVEKQQAVLRARQNGNPLRQQAEVRAGQKGKRRGQKQ